MKVFHNLSVNFLNNKYWLQKIAQMILNGPNLLNKGRIRRKVIMKIKGKVYVNFKLKIEKTVALNLSPNDN